MKKTIIVIFILIFIIGIILIINKLDSDFMKSCTEAGFSKEHCEVHK